MALSGSYDFKLTAEKIVEEAFKAIGVKTAEQELESFEIQDGLDTLNILIKKYQNEGLHLWKKIEAVLFLDVGKSSYNLGPSGDECCELDDFISTTTTNNEAALSTVIEVSDTSGMLSGDNVGIKMDSNSRHWTTIVSVDSATQITITTGISSASASGSSVFTFTNLIQKPLRVLSARRKTFNIDSEIEVLSWTRQEYFNQVNKLSQGSVVNFYYNPKIDDGRFYVWQTSSSVDNFVRFTFQKPMNDVDISTDDVDFPSEWYSALIYNLAFRLTPMYDVPPSKAQTVLALAESELSDALGFDQEDNYFSFQPDFE